MVFTWQDPEFVVCGETRCLQFPTKLFDKLKSTDDKNSPTDRGAKRSDKCTDDPNFWFCYANTSEFYNKDRYFSFGESLLKTYEMDDNGNGVYSNKEKLKNKCPSNYSWFKYLANYNGSKNDYYGLCKRNITADKNTCCGIKNTDPNKCDVEFTYKSDKCNQFVQDSCNNIGNWGNNTMCSNFCFNPENRDICANQLSNYCGHPDKITSDQDCVRLYSQLFTNSKANKLTPSENMIFNNMLNTDLKTCESSIDKIKTDPTCRGFCTREDLQSNHRVRCDEMALKYCKSSVGKSDTTFCSCINKTDNLAFPFIPICDGTMCVGDGYKTLDLIQASTKCPPCSQKFSTNGAGTVTGNSQKLECNIYKSNLQGAQSAKDSTPDLNLLDRNENIWKQGQIIGNIDMFVYNTIGEINKDNFILANKTSVFSFNNYMVGELRNNYTILFLGYIKPNSVGNYKLFASFTGEITILVDGNVVMSTTSDNSSIKSSSNLVMSNNKWAKIKIIYKFTTGTQSLNISLRPENTDITKLSLKDVLTGGELACGDGNWVNKNNSTSNISPDINSTTANSTINNTPDSDSTSISNSVTYNKYITNYDKLSDADKSNLQIWIVILSFIILFIGYKYMQTDKGKELKQNARKRFRSRRNND